MTIALHQFNGLVAFVAVTRAAAAMMPICERRQATRDQAHGSEERPTVEQSENGVKALFAKHGYELKKVIVMKQS